MTRHPGPEQLLLRALTPDDEAEAWSAHDELALEGFDFLLGARRPGGWPDYLDRLERERLGRDLPEGRVPATFLVADVGGALVGRVSIRHELDDHLAVVGGHIGYAVRPRFRRRGYATAMLRRSLLVARSVGVEQALVTCDDRNAGSVATIERCGGVLLDTVPAPGTGRLTRRYRVGTDPGGTPDR